MRELTQRHPIALVNSVNPLRLEGQKTAAFEVVEALGELDALCIPVGNAGNITAYWKGFREAGHEPRMLGFQAAGAAPLVHGAPVERPETVASAIRIGNPARWEEAMAAVTESRGAIEAVTDEEILAAYRLLASREGVFCEPASAASVAGLLKHGARGASRVVCVLTGHGLKDPQTALEQSGSVVRASPSSRRSSGPCWVSRRRRAAVRSGRLDWAGPAPPRNGVARSTASTVQPLPSSLLRWTAACGVVLHAQRWRVAFSRSAWSVHLRRRAAPAHRGPYRS